VRRERSGEVNATAHLMADGWMADGALKLNAVNWGCDRNLGLRLTSSTWSALNVAVVLRLFLALFVVVVRALP